MLPEIDPIAPSRSHTVPVGRQWRYELKLDGFRGVLYVENARGFFRSKTKRGMPRFQELADRIARKLNVRDAIFDGEIFVMTRKKLPDFAALMFRRGRSEYAAFDLLWLSGVATNRNSSTRRYALDLEGIVTKLASDPYGPEAKWLKVKHPDYSQNEGRWKMFSRSRR